MSDPEVQHWQARAFEVYTHHADVFATALARLGRVRLDVGLDLIHDFLLEHLPAALPTYVVDRGPIEPWLFTIFSRYARRRLREEAATMAGALRPEDEAVAAERGEPVVGDSDRAAFRKASMSLSEPHRQALAIFLAGQSPWSVREVARTLAISRHRARLLVLEACGQVAAQVPEQVVLTRQERDVLRLRLGEGLDGQQTEQRLQLPRGGAERLVRSAVRKMAHVLAEPRGRARKDPP